jgi:hypothetical protein
MIRATVLLYFFLFFYSCSAPLKPEQKEGPTGLFINKTLLDSLGGEVLLGGVPRLCEEILFLGNDTLEINNIVEKTRVHFSSNEKGSYFIDDSNMIRFPFTLKNETIALWDTGYLQTKTPSLFIRSEKSFVKLLNDKIISGTYTIQNKQKIDTLEFDAQGNIYNWEKWNKFELCLAGDCASMSEEPANIIHLINDKQDDFYIWKNYKNPYRLVLYSLADEDPEIKGDRKLLNDSLVFIKIK